MILRLVLFSLGIINKFRTTSIRSLVFLELSSFLEVNLFHNHTIFLKLMEVMNLLLCKSHFKNLLKISSFAAQSYLVLSKLLFLILTKILTLLSVVATISVIT